VFRIARREDDAAIRQLLRDNPIRGSVTLSLEREPSFFDGAAALGGEHVAAVATDSQSGRIIAMGEVCVRGCYLNGQAQCIGYLSALRVDASCAAHIKLLRSGYDFVRQVCGTLNARAYFTSIAADNHRARRFLEAGLPGMPVYRFLSGFTTYLIASRKDRECRGHRGVGFRNATRDEFPAIAAFLREQRQNRHLAPVWSEQDASRPASAGPGMNDFVLAHRRDQIIGTAALWDQRGIKQAVIRGYAPALRCLRPFVNLIAPIIRTPGLPAVGQPVSQAFISHLSAPAGPPEVLLGLMNRMRVAAASRGIEWIAVGLPDGDPLGTILTQHFRCRTYRSRLYLVQWEGCEDVALEDGPVAPEVALL
jgi:hypothetical protein